MRNLNTPILPGLFLAALPGWVVAADPGTQSWHFTVLLDGKRIGQHDFVIRRQGDEVVAENVAHFKVGVAFIPLYAYDHENHEIWRGGCVTEVSSRTNDNGHKLFVQGALEGEVFEVKGSRGALRLPGCVRTFAYWDLGLISAPPLLNTQTGELQAVSVTAGGVQNIRAGGKTLAATRYLLRAPHLAIDAWYSAAGDWVALESKLEGGRMLRYALQ